MKFTLAWLKDHLETSASLDEISARLTMLGLEVEGIEDAGAALKPFTIARIIKAEQHPNADRLRVCTVETGNTSLQIVCGAPNARAGIKVALSRPGDTIPSTGAVLKAGTIRGVESQGMLCSARELGLSEEQDGILELPEDAIIGDSILNSVNAGDPVIDIALTPNRGDCAGVRGIARDLAASGLGTLKLLAVEKIPGVFASTIRVTIDESAKEGCPLFVGRAFRNVKNGESPAWLKQRLMAIGLKPISALVDITNYFCFDLCRPLHVFDADKITGGLTVRFARTSENFAALNGKTYDLKSSTLVLADDRQVESLAGVMGGAASGVSAETTSVFLEVALFKPAIVAATGRDLQLLSDARYRFERGLDPAFVLEATELASKIILEFCGGEASEIVVAGAEPIWQKRLGLRDDRVQTLGGVSIPMQQQIRLLEGVGCSVQGGDITPPSWRPDIEGEADLVEEVLRLNGYDKIPATPLPRNAIITKSALTPSQKRQLLAKRILARRGLNEAVTFSFLSSLKNKVDPSFILQNPISSDLDAMRPSLLPNLVDAALRNAARGSDNAALFEVGPVFTTEAANNGQKSVAGFIRSGEATAKGWSEAARSVDAYDAKGDVLALLSELGVNPESLVIEAKAGNLYHPYRAGTVRLGNKILAEFGELHPNFSENAGGQKTVGGEVFLDALPEQKKKGTAKSLLNLAAFQTVTRDFAFVVVNTIEAEILIKALRGVDKTLITAVRLFDVYSGKGVDDGYKSLAVAVTLQPTDRTLTDTDIDAVAAKIVVAAEQATGAKLRA